MKPELVIFDLEGTLYQNPYQQLRMFLKCWKFRRYFLRLEKARMYSGERTAAGHEISVNIAKFLDPQQPRRSYDWYLTKFYPAFVESLKPEDCRPMVNELLRYLRAQRIRTAVLSDYSMVDERLAILGIDNSLIDFTHSAENDLALKPHLSSYETVINRLGKKPEKTLIVSSSYQTDGLAAEDLGASFIHINSKKEWANFLKLAKLDPYSKKLPQTA